MRIALVVTGGVDRSGREHVIPSLLWLIERLAWRHELVVYALRYHEQPCTYRLLGATVHDLGRPRGIRRQYGALLAALRREARFDVIHGYWALPAGLAAAAAGRRLGVPVIVTCDSGEFVSISDIQYGAQCRWRQRLAIVATLRLARCITVCSAYQAGLARVHGAAPIVLPLGVDRQAFSPAPTANGPPWRLLHVASLNPVKDHDTLLRALAILVQRGLDVRLDVVGEDALAGAVPARAAALGVRERITFHGFLPTDGLTSLYQRAHLFVLSSRHEAAGVVLLEAAASGIAVVGTRVGYLADWAPDRAVAVTPADAAALATAVESLLLNPTDRARLAEAARTWTLAHDADWTAAQFEHLYARLARSPTRH